MLYDLRHSDLRVRWLVTLLLATLGTSYLFGAWMVGLYAGFSTQQVAETYSSAGEAPMRMPMPPETTMVTERPVSMAEMGEEQHHVDRDLLVQDTHVHMPMYAVIAACLAVITLGLSIRRWVGLAIITLLAILDRRTAMLHQPAPPQGRRHALRAARPESRLESARA